MGCVIGGDGCYGFESTYAGEIDEGGLLVGFGVGGVPGEDVLGVVDEDLVVVGVVGHVGEVEVCVVLLGGVSAGD